MSDLAVEADNSRGDAFCLAILGASNSWYVKDLQRAALKINSVVSVLPFSRMAALVDRDGFQAWSGDETRKALRDCNAILVRSMPAGSLEQVIFRMDILLRCEAEGMTIVNPPRALEMAIDKFLCLAKLKSIGIEVPKTFVCQTFDEAIEAFATLGGDVVLKPLFGGEGRGITRLSDEALAIRAFRMLEQLNAVMYIQKFVPHEGADYRLLVIGEEIYGMRRVNHEDWRTNVSLGARGESLVVTDQLRELALNAAKAVGARICGVDFLPGKDGRLYGLEVNAVPGWRALSKVHSADIAEKVITSIQSLAGWDVRR